MSRLLLLVVIASVLGCSKSVSTADSGGSAGGDKSATANLAKADVVLSAADFHAECQKNSKAVQDKYKDKVIELTGVVDMVTDDPYDAVGYVFLEVKGSVVGVRVATADKNPWLKVSHGSTVKVRGKIDATMPGLYPAEIVETGPDPALRIAAADLAKEYRADKKAASAKYHDKFAHVDGVVAAVGKAQFCPAQVTLKVEGNTLVNCCFGGASNLKPVEALKPGQKVKVFGKLGVFDFEDSNEITVNMCLLSAVE